MEVGVVRMREADCKIRGEGREVTGRHVLVEVVRIGLVADRPRL